jgi:oxygen-independent coproporphyrinogen-3 oxidase
VDALRTEIDGRDPRRPVESAFIGGGTPTVLPAETLDAVLRAVTNRAGRPREFTVEANPSSVDELKLDLLRRHGVNRISFGAQSFQRAELAVLERLHDPRHIAESVAAARRAGFDNVNLDLIYAIPGQTMVSWRDSLRRALALDTPHLSCYALMYEPGTSLTRLRAGGRLTCCDESLEADMFEMTIDELTAAGFEHYEISNFARPGRRCAANVIYWENREYLGVGPSAVTYLDGCRRRNVPDVRRYVEGMESDPESIAAERERLSPRRRAGETAIQMLRLIDGIDRRRFQTVTGFDAFRLFATAIDEFTQLGLLCADQDRLRLTRRGLLLANRVMEGFILDDSPRDQAAVAPSWRSA